MSGERNHLAALRRRANLTQAEAAGRLGFGEQSSVSRLERRDVKTLPYAMIERIARAYRATVEEVMGRKRVA